MKISKRLKQYRLDHNLTQAKMCSELGLSIKTYNDLEAGKTNVNTITVDKIAKLNNLKDPGSIYPGQKLRVK